MKNLGIYIHIPFCNNLCPYCDFYSAVKGSNAKSEYISSLVKSIGAQPFGKLAVDTVYFGGGTPSCMEPEQLVCVLEALSKSFCVSSDAEITLESNPESASADNMRILKTGGFSRVSFGVQSLNPRELAALGRIHNAQQAKDAIMIAKEVGFEHVSADIMLGTPHQTLQSLQKSLEELSTLPLDHISAYMLSIEENTPFGQMDIKKDCLDDDGVSDAYLQTVKQLEEYGFMQYEISNFAKVGGQSRHNLKYWNTMEYIGFGPSAHSFYDGKRFEFTSNLDEFLASDGDFANAILNDTGGDYDEYAMLKLRLKPGLDLKEYKARYPLVETERLLKKAESFAKQGLLTLENGVITYTPQGFLMSNYLTAELLY